MNRNIDYLIIGQGLAGTALAWELIRRDKSVMVFDEPAENRASAMAAGLFNPITGRGMTQTWMAETIFPFMEEFYTGAEKVLGKKFFHPLPIYSPFISREENESWQQKNLSGGLNRFLLKLHGTSSFGHQVSDPFGGIEIAHSGYLDVGVWIGAVRDFLKEQNAYLEETFQVGLLSTDGPMGYKQFSAGKVIFCNGLSALDSNWFGWLPLKPLKGEILEVRIQFQPERIYNRNVYVVPTHERNTFKVGATYQHPPFPANPTPEAREHLSDKLRGLIRLPFEVIHQGWGMRPTTPDRRPMLGNHPGNKNVILFNGLGTKGVSLSPYFAHQLADWLEGVGDLSPEVNIYRFKALYSELP